VGLNLRSVMARSNDLRARAEAAEAALTERTQQRDALQQQLATAILAESQLGERWAIATQERDEAQKELSELNAALAEREQWRSGKFGICAICQTTVFHTDGCIEDERGIMHPLCPILLRAEQAEAALAEARQKLDEAWSTAETNFAQLKEVEAALKSATRAALLQAAEDVRGLSNWIRTPGNISPDDARDECARAVANVAKQFTARAEALKG
jgi:septal ring factor EnvC (AmiA/AmiB activator)